MKILPPKQKVATFRFQFQKVKREGRDARRNGFSNENVHVTYNNKFVIFCHMTLLLVTDADAT